MNYCRRMPFTKNKRNNIWEKCDLRKFLNTEFYDTFSEAAKSRILETNITDQDNPWHGRKCGKPTADKIFLLNFEEVVRYFSDSGKLVSNIMCGEQGIEDEYNSARIA